MENEQIAGNDVNNENTAADSNLIQLEGEVRAVNRANDINAKINLLENSLSDLQSELDNINSSVDKGLERLGDNNLDLTSRVSETYKRLGEIDKTYKTLSGISSNIDSEVKKLTSEISSVAELSAADLEKLESSTSEQTLQLNRQHEQLVGRVNELVRHSAETSAQLSESIQHNTDTLLRIEKDLSEEIDLLANATQDRDSALAGKLDEAGKEIENGKARMLKMQKVDEALAGRAAALEASTAELVNKTREIDSSIELLDLRTKDLSTSVEKLREESARQASLIVSIQQHAARMASSVAALADTEGRHFRQLSVAFVLALVAIALLYFYQASMHSNEALVTAQRSLEVDQQLTGLQLENRTADSAISVVENDLAALNNQLNDEVQVLQSRLLTMDDQVQSLGGRIDHVAPYSRFGKDSVIHGPEWLAQLAAQSMVIQLAVVADRARLYETAQRYRHYFTEQMAYYKAGGGADERYVLVYGSFANAGQASAAIRRMPRYINDQQPRVINVGDIQRLI